MLFTHPGEKEWTVIIYKDTSLGGGLVTIQRTIWCAFKAVPVKLAEPVETFTIDISDLRDDSATIDLIWEKNARTGEA